MTCQQQVVPVGLHHPRKTHKQAAVHAESCRPLQQQQSGEIILILQQACESCFEKKCAQRIDHQARCPTCGHWTRHAVWGLIHIHHALNPIIRCREESRNGLSCLLDMMTQHNLPQSRNPSWPQVPCQIESNQVTSLTASIEASRTKSESF